ncbi:MAG: sigma-54 dependent transcriptional regulator [Ignavibacteriales bacterium]|nr:sigma-54 dependent transcriptional regulator [Ignavibacteriales bacterium]
MPRILVIDDEVQICESIKFILEYENYEVRTISDSSEVVKGLIKYDPDLTLLDIQMPGLTGFDILKQAREENIHSVFIVISAHSNLENAVTATKLGAFDFIEKPIDREKLLLSIRNGLEHKKLLSENKTLKKKLSSEARFIGKSPAILNVLEMIDRVASTDSRVLITGENGTGKELIAREIHNSSQRKEAPFIEVNCAAIPQDLIESELFGHEKGSFTGALQKRIGKFEQADKGTIFLDEVGDMSLPAQAKVLRVIEDSCVQRVGGNGSVKVNVRIISATNKNLPQAIAAGEFREDLYHRLNVLPIFAPPLRERKEDIPLLADFFMDDLCIKNNFRKKSITNEGYSFLKELDWRGNVRELRNFIERILILSNDETLGKVELKKYLFQQNDKRESLFDLTNSFQMFKDNAESTFIKKQLDANDWNITKTADILGIQRSHLYGKIKKFNLTRE